MLNLESSHISCFIGLPVSSLHLQTITGDNVKIEHPKRFLRSCVILTGIFIHFHPSVHLSLELNLAAEICAPFFWKW